MMIVLRWMLRSKMMMWISELKYFLGSFGSRLDYRGKSYCNGIGEVKVWIFEREKEKE